MKKQPELLCPAGTYKNMIYALAYGADAIYAGQPRYSLRVRNNDFTMQTLCDGIEYAHALGKQFFVASNLLAHDDKVKTYVRDMQPVIEMQPDALIMSDPGLIMLVRERWPEQTIHLSVQANTLNTAAVRFWQGVGVKRIILSRELGLEEIAEIRSACPDIELEVFVHGALCIAYSGRCLLSGYFNHRDPNQGACTNACRWQYKVLDAAAPADKSAAPVEVPAPQVAKEYLLEERTRPGQAMPIEEDEHGTYIMNSKDLRAIQHVETLADTGIDSLKIEGRTKSHFYTARTAQLYRRALDDWQMGRPFDMRLLGELDGMASRGYTEGFYRRHPPQEMQNYELGSTRMGQQRFAGEIDPSDAQGDLLAIEIKNKVRIGDEVELMFPDGNILFNLTHLENMQGQRIEEAPGSGHRVRIALPDTCPRPRPTEFGLMMVSHAPAD